jgi:hypothetical protein
MSAFGPKSGDFTSEICLMNKSARFTFYGDLLGVAAAYRLSPNVAYEKLNSFYNTVFNLFEDFCVQPDRHFQVYMFSDSVLMWGKAVVAEVLERLQQVYLNLAERIYCCEELWFTVPLEK